MAFHKKLKFRQCGMQISLSNRIKFSSFIFCFKIITILNTSDSASAGDKMIHMENTIIL